MLFAGILDNVLTIIGWQLESVISWQLKSVIGWQLDSLFGCQAGNKKKEHGQEEPSIEFMYSLMVNWEMTLGCVGPWLAIFSLAVWQERPGKIVYTVVVLHLLWYCTVL